VSSEFEDALRALVEKSIARNHEGRSEFASMSKKLQQMLISGVYGDLDEFIDGLAPIGDEVRRADGETVPVRETGSS
jgi:hypothetical protein